MQGQTKLRNYLTDEIHRRKKKNTSYSLRSFARNLGMPPAALSEFLNGKRKLSKKYAEAILSKIDDVPSVKEEILDSFAGSKAQNLIAKKSLQLDADQYFLVADPIYYGILSLYETENTEKSAAWIAKRMNMSLSKADQALKRLLRSNLPGKTVGIKFTGVTYDSNISFAYRSHNTFHQGNNISYYQHELQIQLPAKGFQNAKEKLFKFVVGDILGSSFQKITKESDFSFHSLSSRRWHEIPTSASWNHSKKNYKWTEDLQYLYGTEGREDWRKVEPWLAAVKNCSSKK